MKCSCGARIGERHTRSCELTGVRQPEPRMEGHPSVYRRPLMTVVEAERFQHRVDVLTGTACTDEACPDHGMSSPWADDQGHDDEVRA